MLSMSCSKKPSLAPSSQKIRPNLLNQASKIFYNVVAPADSVMPTASHHKLFIQPRPFSYLSFWPLNLFFQEGQRSAFQVLYSSAYIKTRHKPHFSIKPSHLSQLNLSFFFSAHHVQILCMPHVLS